MTYFNQAGFIHVSVRQAVRMDETLLYEASGAGVGLFPASVAKANNEPAVVFRPITDPTPTIHINLG